MAESDEWIRNPFNVSVGAYHAPTESGKAAKLVDPVPIEIDKLGVAQGQGERSKVNRPPAGSRDTRLYVREHHLPLFHPRPTYQTLTWVGYGAGAACIAGGAILYVLGLHSAAPASTSVALLPAIGPSQAGMTLKGAF